LLASECLATILYFWGPWKTLTLGWVEARARYVSCCPFRSGNAPLSSVRRRPSVRPRGAGIRHPASMISYVTRPNRRCVAFSKRAKSSIAFAHVRKLLCVSLMFCACGLAAFAQIPAPRVAPSETDNPEAHVAAATLAAGHDWPALLGFCAPP